MLPNHCKLLLKRGNYIILTVIPNGFPYAQECCFYMNENFPLADIQALIDTGQVDAREATTEEKAFCYWCIEHYDTPACMLCDKETWYELKENL